MALQRTAGNRSTARLLQRAMKLELQTGNVIWKAREGEPTEKLPRKFGPQAFIHKGTQGKARRGAEEGDGGRAAGSESAHAKCAIGAWSSATRSRDRSRIGAARRRRSRRTPSQWVHPRRRTAATRRRDRLDTIVRSGRRADGPDRRVALCHGVRPGVSGAPRDPRSASAYASCESRSDERCSRLTAVDGAPTGRLDGRPARPSRAAPRSSKRSLPAGVPQAQPSGQVVGARVRAR